jgi:hypothetical protein
VEEARTDGLLAHMAWSEGEANLVALQLLFEGLGMTDLVERLDAGQLLGGRLAPQELTRLAGAERELLRFVYDEGFATAAETFRGGGWKALDRAVATRRTTRDLLHPGRVPIEPAAFAEPVPPTGEAWVLADEDSLGEQGILILVSSLTGKDDLGLQAGDGWAGDRLYRWERTAGTGSSSVTVWITRWVTEADAADFDYAYGRALSTRFPDRKLEPAGEGARGLTTADRVFRVERRGTEVRVTVEPPLKVGTSKTARD